ncbi:MAG TPA: alpha-galactosidase [Opitutaceae bacterium]
MKTQPHSLVTARRVVSRVRRTRTLRDMAFGFAVAALALSPCARADDLVNQEELASRDQWVRNVLLSSDKPVVSFRYDGTPSSQLLPGWRKAPMETSQLPGGRSRHSVTWTDPRTGLSVRMVVTEYADYPAVDWTAYLKNEGSATTPLIEGILGIDSQFGRAPAGAVLRTTQGDNYSAASYQPLEYALDAEAKSFEPVGGRPTNGAWPYFNIDYGQRGILVALGWPGQWQARFAREKNEISVRGGQETTHLRLEPGEEIRTPLVALVFWKGENWIEGQNLWRHWFLAHNIPRPGGSLPPLDTMICPPVLFTSAAGDISFLNSYLSAGVKTDYLWVDAGWYPTKHDWFAATGVGTWVPDPERYPKGVREVSDYAHSKGMKFVLWFEPERVYRGSYLWDNHPEWLLHWDSADKGHEDLRLLNLGNPEALRWLTERISTFISEQGVDVYRQDFNVDPLQAWQNNDTPDRQGMTENLYVQGYLAFWDALLERHPGLMIDSCASGGRRNDLETLRRGVPLLRSDYQAPGLPDSNGSMTTDVFDGNQGQTYGLSLWVPYYGTGEYGDDVYSARSHLCPWLGLGTHLEDPDWPDVRRQLADHSAIAKYFYGDYYPLTPYSSSQTSWMAWEFFRPGKKDGSVQAFRRENEPSVTANLKLLHLNPSAQYEFTNIDSGRTTRLGGRELMTTGLPVSAAAPRTALILTFREVQ